LLSQAIKRRGLDIIPIVILNDTVGTLIMAHYQDKASDIGSIIGTGYNTCYIEKEHPHFSYPVIINMESADFDIGLPRTNYDLTIDETSEKPGEHVLEKMCSGKYLGEILRLVLYNYSKNNPSLSSLINSELFSIPYSINTGSIDNFINSNFHPDFSSKHVSELLKALANIIITRSARIIAATYAGTILHIDPNIENSHIIAVDGSVYEKLTGYKEIITESICEFFGDKSSHIKIKLVKDGSGAGAAIACAMQDIDIYKKNS
jgi:hexokinase